MAEAAGVAPEQILGHDLFLYLRGRGSVLGVEGELIGSPKLDDLACAFALTEGFLQSSPSGAIPVLAVFDNEDKFFVYLKSFSGPEERIVTIGRSNDAFVEITSGLEEGDVVYLYRPFQSKEGEK